MNNQQLDIADFVQVANTLTNESFTGNVHLSICKGIQEIDPFIGKEAPVFFTYTFYGHLYAAQLYAIKLFDKQHEAFTVPKFLEMVRRRSTKFPNRSEKQILEDVAKADSLSKELEPAVRILCERRNKYLAHISGELVFEIDKLRESKLSMEEIEKVLYQGGRIVNQFLILWSNSSNQLRETNSDDYKRVVSLMSKQLCAEIKAEEAEFARHGLTTPLPRPKDCL
jgi:HEPN superfamily AbiU2-like protein